MLYLAVMYVLAADIGPLYTVHLRYTPPLGQSVIGQRTNIISNTG